MEAEMHRPAGRAAPARSAALATARQLGTGSGEIVRETQTIGGQRARRSWRDMTSEEYMRIPTPGFA